MTPRSSARLVATTLLLLIGSGVAGARASQSDGNVVTFFDLETTAPTSWTSVEPSSSMRLLQMSVPGSGDTAAELVVFFFGAGQGGDVPANVERWRGQFTGPGGGEVDVALQTFDVAGMPVTVAELSGTYRRGVGGAPAEPLPDQTLVAAIVETDRGSLFIQLHGPSATVAANRDAFDAFLRGLRASGD